MEKGSTVYSFTYDAVGRPVAITEGNTRYFYVLNQQGDVVAIINGNGDFVVEYYYDAWGRLLSTTGTLATTLGANNPLRYRGYVYDTETGLYYLQSRYYNPTWSRFINADSYVSTGQKIIGYNMFAYCGNNPVSRTDCTGERYEVTHINTSAKEEENGKVLYYTTISFRNTAFRSWHIPGLFGSYTVTFTYHITSDGVILYDNKQNGSHFLEKTVVRKALAQEMHRMARTQVSGAMEGRTIKGISLELLMHYKAYRWGVFYDNAEESFIGSKNKKGEKGHDSNSWIFEVLSFLF